MDSSKPPPIPEILRSKPANEPVSKRQNAPAKRGTGAAMAWSIGLNFAYYVVGAAVLGLAIDYFAGTTPLWTLILLGIGLVGGGWRFIREASVANRRLSAGMQGQFARRSPKEIDEEIEAEAAENRPNEPDESETPHNNR